MFDEDSSGTLNFYELMSIKYAKMTTARDKLDWIFKVVTSDRSVHVFSLLLVICLFMIYSDIIKYC